MVSYRGVRFTAEFCSVFDRINSQSLTGVNLVLTIPSAVGVKVPTFLLTAIIFRQYFSDNTCLVASNIYAT